MTKPLDEDSRMLIDFLKSLPSDSMLPWTSDHITEDQPWAAGYADIRLPYAVLDALETRWNWTIVLPWDDDTLFEDEEYTYPWAVPVDPDMAVFMVCNSYDQALEIAIPINRYPNEEEIIRIQEALDEDPENILIGSAGWTAQRISNVLHYWSDAFADRQDIYFEWTPALGLSRELQHAQEIMEKVMSGEMQTYIVKPGEKEGGEGITIKVTDEIMEAMLQAELDRED